MLLHVAPPLLSTVTTLPALPTDSLAVPRPSLPLGAVKHEMVDISFQSTGTGKYAMPTGHLNFNFAPLAVSYKLFPW